MSAITSDILTCESSDTALIQIMHDGVLHDKVDAKLVLQLLGIRIQLSRVLVEHVPPMLVVALEADEHPE